jgi:CDP-diacylglycerol--glycerol-3-phosphate 3-phosphatidyltransferase
MGGILKELGDVLSDAVLYLPLAYVPGISPAVIVSFVVLANATEIAGILVKVHGGKRRYDGPLGKSNRAFVIGFLGLVGGFGIPLAHWADGLLVLLSVMLILTIANRIRRGLTDISGIGRGPGL